MSLEIVEDKEVQKLFNEAQGRFVSEWLSCCLRCVINTQALSLGMAEPNCKKCKVPKLVRQVFPKHNRGYGFRQFWQLLDC